jgi:hypothetical protein
MKTMTKFQVLQKQYISCGSGVECYERGFLLEFCYMGGGRVRKM